MKHKGLKRQGSLYVLAVLCLAVAAGIVVPRLWPQTTQACTEYTRAKGENFDTVDFKDTTASSVAHWPSGPITLPPLGSNFVVGAADKMGRRIYDCAAGDFDGDGYPDLIGLDISGEYTTPVSSPMSEIRLIRNLFPTNAGAMPLFGVDMATSYDKFYNHTGPCAITAGDYNGDGLLDFFFMRNSSDIFGYDNFKAAMYINIGTPTVPAFTVLDFTSAFKTAGIYVYWAANHFASVNIDAYVTGDTDTDILVASANKIYIVRNPGSANFVASDWTITEMPYDAPPGFTGVPGTSCVAAADFDGDGDPDVVAGTVGTQAFLAFYENDGTGHFTRSEIAITNATCVGSVGIEVQDFTGDGRPDIFVATDEAYRGGTAQARIWFLRNLGVSNGEVSWLFKCLNSCLSPTPSPYDIDMATSLDYDQDGDMDIVIADANHSGDYYYIKNELAGVYELYGLAQSTDIGAGYLDPRLNAVTRIRVTSIRQGVLNGSSTGLAVEVLFSNNGGRNWETYQTFSGSAIANASNLAWYDFKNFGADLRWRIILTATDDKMADYENASFETPYVDVFEIEFIYVDRREYSRASAAATIVTSSGINKKLVIGTSFIFPGWEGQLRAYDVTSVSFAAGSTSELRTITTSNLNDVTGRNLIPGAEIYWDAGALLDGRTPDSRTVYTAIRANGTLTNPLVRTNFTRANVSTLATFLQDTQSDNAGLIDFVRGKDRYWKMGDINHSTPVVVGPPSEDPAYMGSGYDTFKLTNASRTKVVYVGANDGMLHCFDAASGDELWGFIPYNLLRKLKNMYAVDATNKVRYYAHDIYCDGSPSVADVFINGAWKTVLVAGQGPGIGSTLGGGYNYYWALDVTDPSNPLPLWEISHTYTSGSGKNQKTYRTMGETWSTPAIGKVSQSGTARWVAFMGSGYDNDATYDVGRRFYVVRLDTGEVIRYTDEVSQVDTSSLSGAKSAYSYTNIVATIPGSPTAVDLDGNGFTDSVFVGDLDGRLYRMDVVSSTNPSNWKLLAIYTDYLNYPIITKPGVWTDPLEGGPARARVYFGTGGDDAAPAGRDYSFVAVIDNGETSANKAAVEWYLGVAARLNLSDTYRRGGLGVGSKVWADPVVADQIIYFSTLTGSIEAVNPCLNLGEAGRLYARYLRTTSALPVGGTAFKTTSATPPEYLQLVSKARRAVTVGEAERVAGRVNKREIYVQEYDSTLEKLEQPIGSLLRIKSWREIYRIIW
jgi:PilY1 beta-propeller domain/FG-GAP-like repeat